MRIKFFLLAIMLAFTSSCSTLNKSVLTGVGIGAATGVALGNNHASKSSKSQSRTNGLLIGSALGGLLGWAIFESKNKKKKELAKNNNDLMPLLTRPKIKKVWIEDQVKGNRFIKGHWEYVIKENSQWNK